MDVMFLNMVSDVSSMNTILLHFLEKFQFSHCPFPFSIHFHCYFSSLSRENFFSTLSFLILFLIFSITFCFRYVSQFYLVLLLHLSCFINHLRLRFVAISFMSTFPIFRVLVSFLQKN